LYSISVETHFWASHRLRLADGSNEPSHGHNWAVAAQVSAKRLNSMGLAIDFGRIRVMLDGIVAKLDNQPLEKLDYFGRNNPSAENVAKYVFDKLEPQLPKNLKLDFVQITEQPGCAAKYAP
jgi:6-pyruvoyltetrahydropterin/6-carboxytetrahydropterin synthase